jgi:eukaryotic translation initiation factor 2C
VNVSEARIAVNLDEENGRLPRPSGPDIIYVVIRPSKTIRMAVISAYLTKKMPFDTSILECISKLIHVSQCFLANYCRLP